MHKDLRERSINEIQEIGFDGYAIGGLSVGENKRLCMNDRAHNGET